MNAQNITHPSVYWFVGRLEPKLGCSKHMRFGKRILVILHLKLLMMAKRSNSRDHCCCLLIPSHIKVNVVFSLKTKYFIIDNLPCFDVCRCTY